MVMSTTKVIKPAIIIATSVYVGLLIALLFYSIVHNVVGGSESLTKAYIANVFGLIVWAASALLIGKFIEEQTARKK
jgi:hypothetical protein